MNCPGCTHPMKAEHLAAQYGGVLEIDVCHHCNGLWFDGKESVQLAPGSTLKLFSAMYARQKEARQPLVPNKRCPRCTQPLIETFDQQRGTRFSYFRCESHGRFTTFFQFLREKNLVRAPTPRQLTELKASVKQVSCSNCGSPIVLADSMVCLHCQAPVSILSEETINQTLTALQAQEVKRTTVDPTLAARLVMDKLDVARFENENKQYRWSVVAPTSGAADLIELGANAVIAILDILT